MEVRKVASLAILYFGYDLGRRKKKEKRSVVVSTLAFLLK